MAKYGNTNVSSLMSAAKSAMAKRVTLEDSIASYEYDLSPKDQAAYQKYVDHLSGRLQQYQGVDPAKALSYQKALTTANRGFTSSEISRQSTQILYGNQSPQGKLQTLIGLYQRAMENGDENLAQRLEGQAASLQQTVMSAGRGGGGGGFGGGGGSSTDPQVKGWQTMKGDLENHNELLQQMLREGKISTKEYLGGGVDKNGNKFTGIHDTMQGLEDVRKQAFDYAQQTGDPSAINFVSDLSQKMRSHEYQNYINQSGLKGAAGQQLGSKTYDYQTGQWEFKTPGPDNLNGYSNSPMGQLLKLKDQSGNNLVFTDSDNYQMLLPKNQMNKVGEKKSGDRIDWQQYSGYLPGTENTPSTDSSIYGPGFNPTEMIFTQDENGKTAGAIPKIAAMNPITHQLNVDPTTGQARIIRPEDIGPSGTAGTGEFGAGFAIGPTNKFFQGVANDVNKTAQGNKPLQDAIDKGDIPGWVTEYGKSKVGQIFNSKNANDVIGKINQASSFLGHGSKMGSVGGFMSNPMRFLGDIGQLAMKATGLGQQVEAKKQADAANAAAEAARQQAALQASIAQAKANLPKPAQAPYKPAPQYSPSYGTVGNIQQGFTADPFSKAGIGTGSLYRL